MSFLFYFILTLNHSPQFQAYLTRVTHNMLSHCVISKIREYKSSNLLFSNQFTEREGKGERAGGGGGFPRLSEKSWNYLETEEVKEKYSELL